MPEEFIKDLRLGIPSEPEQKSIAAYLDKKTGQIDALIGKKKELIKKLNEQRSAIITHAVTKGLPARGAQAGLAPNAPMKDSGIEWLGQVPEHWDVSELFRLTEMIQTGPFGTQLHQSDYVEDGVPLINPAHIVDGRLQPHKNCTVTEETVERLSRYRLKGNDLVFARRGEIGRCGVVRFEHDGWLCGTGSMVVRFENVYVNYYDYYCRNSGFIDELNLYAVGTTMLNINPAILGRRKVLVPPLKEQQNIIDYLDEKTGQLDGLIGKAEKAIGRLEEYRTAVITAAVTGKVKVV